MPALATPKDEMFCQGVASGLSHAEAWRKATGKVKNADVCCDQLLGKIGIRERIAELKEANSRKATPTSPARKGTAVKGIKARSRFPCSSS